MAAAATVIMLLVVTRVLGTSSAGVFALALTIGQQFQMLGAFEVRPFHATDVGERFGFGTYHASRLYTSLLMIAGVAAYALIAGTTATDALLIMLIACLRTFDAFEDVFHGELQRRGHLDLAGRAYFWRTLITTVAFSGLVMATRDLLLSCVLTLVISLVALIALNLPVSRAVFSLRPNFGPGPVLELLRLCLPLAIGASLSVFLMSAPRLGIEHFLSREDQAEFAILFMPALVINLLSLVLFKPLLTRMATHWVDGDVTAFTRVVRNGLVAVAGASILTLTVSWAIGLPLLSFIYGVDLVGRQSALLILVVGGALNATGVILYYALVTMRQQRAVFIGYVAAAATVALLSWLLIPRLGMLGAGVAYGGAMGLLAMVFAAFVVATVRASHPSPAQRVG